MALKDIKARIATVLGGVEGIGQLRFARLSVDRALLERARELARSLLERDGPWHDAADALLHGANPSSLA